MKQPKAAAPVDIRKVIRAAMEAALEEPAPEPQSKKHGRHGGRALVLGAGLFTAGRLLIGARGSGLLDSIQGRLGSLGVDLPGKPPVDPELDDEDLMPLDSEPDDEDSEPDDEELIDDPDEDLEEDPDAVEDEDLEDEGETNGGGPPVRRPRSRRRG